MERKQWCTSYRNLTGKDWSGFAFSDEYRFKLRSDGRAWVWPSKPKSTFYLFIRINGFRVHSSPA